MPPLKKMSLAKREGDSYFSYGWHRYFHAFCEILWEKTLVKVRWFLWHFMNGYSKGLRTTVVRPL